MYSYRIHYFTSLCIITELCKSSFQLEFCNIFLYMSVNIPQLQSWGLLGEKMVWDAAWECSHVPMSLLLYMLSWHAGVQPRPHCCTCCHGAWECSHVPTVVHDVMTHRSAATSRFLYMPSCHMGVQPRPHSCICCHDTWETCPFMFHVNEPSPRTTPFTWFSGWSKGFHCNGDCHLVKITIK